MKRRAFKLLLLLLAGAIINVAVAWGYAANHDLDYLIAGPNARGDLTADQRSILEGTNWTWHDGRTIRWSSYQRHGALIWRCTEEKKYFHDGSQWLEIRTAGWPLLGLTGAMLDDPDRRTVSGRVPILTSIFRLRWPTTLQGKRFWMPRYLPYAPIWPGFAINTIFYAAVLLVLFAVPFKVRRWRRIRRGQCASCGYSLRCSVGLMCPECGASVPRIDLK